MTSLYIYYRPILWCIIEIVYKYVNINYDPLVWNEKQIIIVHKKLLFKISSPLTTDN